MKRALTSAIAVLMSALTLTACSSSDGFSDSEKISAKYPRSKDISVTYNYADGALEPPGSYNDFANSAGEFSLKLFRAYGSGKESFAFSPASTVLQLSMLCNAASPEVRSDITNALGGTLSTDELNACCSYFKSRMESVSKEGGADWAKVRLDGAMLVDDSVEVKTSFLSTAGNFFQRFIIQFNVRQFCQIGCTTCIFQITILLQLLSNRQQVYGRVGCCQRLDSLKDYLML